MGGFGDRLRREREMRGITLDEICESTKIARRHLEALEKERFEQLPGGVFNKGFVRAYAKFLGIDEDEAVADYAAAANEQPEAEDKFPLEIHDEPDPELNPRRSSLPLIFALAALAGVLVGYFFWLKSKPAAAPVEPPQQASPAPHSSAPETSPVATQSADSSTPAKQEARDSAPTAPALQKNFVLLIKARQDAWVSVVADGKSIMQRTLTAERQKLVRADREIVLRTGNAGGIEVSFNGRPIGALGNENEARTLTFNATGLVQ
jgi:cytoskeleton protein RodZ